MRRIVVAGLALAAIAGCQKPDEIVRYTVPKPTPGNGKAAGADRIFSVDGSPTGERDEAASERAEPGQLLGAIVPRGKTTWFFKLTGPVAGVASQREPFERFIKSIRFSEKGPEWQRPEGWVEEPGTAMRYATLRIPSDTGRLEMSVIPLPTGEGSFDAYLLSNINRWRDQLQVAPLTQEKLSESAVKIDFDDTQAWLVSFEGRLAPPGKGAPPFAGKTPARRDAPIAKASQATLPFTAETPEGWTQAPAGAMQLATYEVRDGSRLVTISVSTAGGDLSANINRWREQVHLARSQPAEIEKEMRTVEVDGKEGRYVELVGPVVTGPQVTGPEGAEKRETILGVVVEVQGRQWFIKLKGNADLAAREKAHFEEFVRSLRFREAR